MHFFKSTAPIHVIRAAPPPPSDKAWASVTSGGFEVHEVPGDHMEIVKDPLAANTAVVIEACLERLDKAPQGVIVRSRLLT